MLEAIGLFLAALDFLNIAEKVEKQLESWHQNFEEWLEYVVDLFTNPVRREEGETLICIPSLVVFVIIILVAIPLGIAGSGGFIPGTIALTLVVAAGIYFVLTMLSKICVFVFNTVIVVLHLFKRTPNGIIGSIGLILAVVGIAQRFMGD